MRLTKYTRPLGVAALLVIIVIVLIATVLSDTSHAQNSATPPEVNLSPNGVTLTWEPTPGAQAYRVGWANYDEVSFAVDHEIPWTERFAFTDLRPAVQQHTITYLKPNSTHVFIVGSRDQTGSISWGPWAVAHTNP